MSAGGEEAIALAKFPSRQPRVAEQVAQVISPVPSEDRPAIRLDGVSFSYGRVPALKEVTLSVGRGELAFLVGPSASGKTTLLKLIHAQLRPQRGRLQVDGRDLTRPRSWTVRRTRRRVGVVFQDYRLMQRLTALENLVYALRVADLWLSRREARWRAAAALRAVGLEERATAFPRQLSGGQQQRLAVARALALRPALLLADEPTASLDESNADNVMALLRSASRSGATVLIATHDAGLANGGRQRVINLAQGEITRDRVLSPRRWGSRRAARRALR